MNKEPRLPWEIRLSQLIRRQLCRLLGHKKMSFVKISKLHHKRVHQGVYEHLHSVCEVDEVRYFDVVMCKRCQLIFSSKPFPSDI